MTRRHFELVAGALRGIASAEPEAVGLLAHVMADELTRTNPRFNRARFLTACGL